MRAQEGSTSSCVRFRLGQQGFGVPMEEIREITAAGRITPVPLAPPVVRGLANLRGRVVTLIDVATVFARPLPPARFLEDRLALILSSPYEHLGLYVHAPVEIGQALSGTSQTASDPSLTMTAAAAAGGVRDDQPPEVPALGIATVSGEFIH